MTVSRGVRDLSEPRPPDHLPGAASSATFTTTGPDEYFGLIFPARAGRS